MSTRQNYCVKPYNTIATTGATFKTPCCLMYDKQHGHHGSIESAWQSEQFQDIRRAFDQDKKHPACQSCWSLEAATGKSPRHSYNEQMGGKTVDTKLTTVQWSFSNTCNFACRTCGIEYSTGWLRDTRLMAEQGNPEAAHFLGIYKKNQFREEQWQEIYAMLPQVERLELIGGEPLINRHLPRILDECGTHAGHIDLQMVTNGSTPPSEELVGLLSRFRSVELTFSVDAVSQSEFELIRTGDWNAVTNSINQWMELDNNTFEYWANITVSILNIWDMDRILSHLDKRFGWQKVYWNWVSRPTFYDAVILPEDIKQHIDDNSSYWRAKKLMQQMWAQKSNAEQWKKFVSHTKFLNKSRGESIQKNMPQLHDIIHTYTKEEL